MSDPHITILMATYNGARFLSAQLDSLLAQSHQNWSLIVSDDGSRDATMAILLGGHVRVGMEDNPYLAPGEYARHNAQLVEKIVRISRELGRDIATPAEARKIIWPSRR